MTNTLNGKLTVEQANHAIDHGLVWARMSRGELWQCRRNGATKTWKTRPGEFRIPVKAGFSACGELTHNNYDVEPDGRIII